MIGGQRVGNSQAASSRYRARVKGPKPKSSLNFKHVLPASLIPFG
jgi:hypothetical protein